MKRILSKIKARGLDICLKAGIHLLKKKVQPASSSALIWTDSGFMPFSRLHAGIGLGLALRGCQPHFIVCDAICNGACVPGTEPPHNPITKSQCLQCARDRHTLFEQVGFAQSAVSAYLNAQDVQNIDNFARHAASLAASNDIASLGDLNFDGVSCIGQDILSTIIRSYRTDDLEFVEPSVAALYARMAGITAIAFKKALDHFNPTYLFIPHNQYAPAGPAVRIARQRGLSYFTYAAHHRGGIAFKTIGPEDSCQSPFAISDAGWQKIRAVPRDSDSLRKATATFFSSRYADLSGDMRFLQGKVGKSDSVKLGTVADSSTPKRKKITIFTHINWDNSFGFGESPFKTFAEWIDHTIHVIMHVDSVDWIIKIHPAEHFSDLERDPEHGVYAQIQKKFPNLPGHISVLPPNVAMNPIDFLQSIDGVISCCGTSGLEAAALGKIVINAASGYYSQRGFTHDPMSVAGDQLNNYDEILRSIAQLPYPTEEQVHDAQKFLLNFFYSRGCQQLSYNNNLGLKIQYPWQLLDFLPGRNKEIDSVCQGFLERADIFFSQEQE